MAGRGPSAGGRARAGAGADVSGAPNARAGAPAASPAQAGSSAAGSNAAASSCTRELLKSTVDAYFAALAAHNSAKLALALAPAAKLTENGVVVPLGEGLWKTAGAAKLKRSAFDVETCSSVTESVIEEAGADIVLGARLKLVAAEVTELETMVVRKGDYVSDAMGLLATRSDDWETPLPADQRASRAQLQGFVDRYFTLFPAGGCMFASDCERFENGFTPGKCSLGLSCSMSMTMSRTGMMNRLSVIDVEAGIAVGFTMFQGKYTDFHMFKVRGGEVHGVHAVLAKAERSGW